MVAGVSETTHVSKEKTLEITVIVGKNDMIVMTDVEAVMIGNVVIQIEVSAIIGTVIEIPSPVVVIVIDEMIETTDVVIHVSFHQTNAIADDEFYRLEWMDSQLLRQVSCSQALLFDLM
jgi:hypothetical protein